MQRKRKTTSQGKRRDKAKAEPSDAKKKLLDKISCFSPSSKYKAPRRKVNEKSKKKIAALLSAQEVR